MADAVLEKLHEDIQEWKQERKDASTIVKEIANLVDSLTNEAKSSKFPVSRLTVEFELDGDDKKVEKLKERLDACLKKYAYFSEQENIDLDKMFAIFQQADLTQIKVALEGADLLHQIMKKTKELTTFLDGKKNKATAYWGIIGADVDVTLPKNQGSEPDYPIEDNKITPIIEDLKSLIIVGRAQDKVVTAEEIRKWA